MQRYFAKEKKENQMVLYDSDFHHIKNVMRMKPQDKIEVVYNETLYLCMIDDIENKKIIIEKQIEHSNDSIPKITLVIPLLKESKMDLILQKATELGVFKIIPVITQRSMIKIDEKKEIKKLDRWKKICKEASEQSHRIDIPIIENILSIKQLEKIEGVKFVCSTVRKDKNLKKILKMNQSCDRIIIAIGPEGGFSLQEEKLLNGMGFESITLGNRIMRVETVPLFLLSVIQYEFME